ncbi:MAG TPA: MarR family transcriptional regulator [Thermoleophilaceae bacterium]|jgi:DNA-binding MarR family transcriptional regulator
MQASSARTQSTSTILEDALLADLWAVTKYLLVDIGRDMVQAIDSLELSFTQVKALQHLYDDVAVSLKTLGERLQLSLPAVSRAVDGLVKRGFVTREEDTDDRRSKLVRITPEGRARVEEMVAIRAVALREFVESLSPEERDLLAPGLRTLAQRPEIAAHIPQEVQDP